ncbi:hypothetical protein [Myxococcus xanthus]|uniref:hypothetical protein n=1 Tax=Myxococcus xanthus TaxID=34 RepID=UPI00112813E5|nr:hypothetical protein [Myxococcus xanthus]
MRPADAVSLFAEAAQADGVPPARVQRVALLVDEALAELDAPAAPVDVRGPVPEDWPPRGNNRRASRPTGVSPTAYRCPGCGAQLERRGTLLLCANDRAHSRDRTTRAYSPGRHGRLVPASRAATPSWCAAVARLTGESE